MRLRSASWRSSRNRPRRSASPLRRHTSRRVTQPRRKKRCRWRQRTINKLRDPLDDAPLTVLVEGISRESATLHVYLGKLAESDWFSAVELQSIERLEDGQAEGFHFAARLIVRPGYGHPSAPPLKRALATHKDEQQPTGG